MAIITSGRASIASSKVISGSGLAMANTMGFFAIERIISLETTFLMDKPINTSAPSMASSSVWMSRLVAKSCLYLFRFVLSLCNTPLVSSITMFSFLAPIDSRSLVQAMADAPAPFTTILTSSFFFPAISSALIQPAAVMMAVPCWSSCMMGICNSFFRRSSISKHSGALMSSRLIPPNVGDICFTVSTNLSTSLVSISISNTSISAKILNNKPFPSITGFPASAPISPNPRTAVPLEMTDTKFPFEVYLLTSSGVFSISRQGKATPGE